MKYIEVSFQAEPIQRFCYLYIFNPGDSFQTIQSQWEQNNNDRSAVLRRELPNEYINDDNIRQNYYPTSLALSSEQVIIISMHNR